MLKGVFYTRCLPIYLAVVSLALLSPLLVYADSVSLGDLKSIPVGSTHVVTPKDKYLLRILSKKSEKLSYDKYFSESDKKFVLEYQSRWSFHDRMKLQNWDTWNDEYYSVGGMNVEGRAPSDHVQREGFANKILRVRGDQFLRKYFANKKTAQVLMKAADSVRNINNVRISFSENGSKKGSRAELRTGYDVFSDSSKMEYVNGGTTLGFYSDRFATSLFQSGLGILEGMEVKLSTQLFEASPITKVSYHFGGHVLNTTLIQPLSSVVVAELLSSRSVSSASDSSQSWLLRLSYQF